MQHLCLTLHHLFVLVIFSFLKHVLWKSKARSRRLHGFFSEVLLFRGVLIDYEHFLRHSRVSPIFSWQQLWDMAKAPLVG